MKITNTISKQRFDALAGYYRMPMATVMAEELGWFEADNERLLGVLIRDREDNDFSGVVLGRDQKRCFRAIDVLPFEATVDVASGALDTVLAEWAKKDDSEFAQGDERGDPVDFFAPVTRKDRLHRSFRNLAFEEAYSPARELIASMMFYYEDPDGNFIEQFQTTGFDARIWELYLFATFTELGYAFDRSHPAPDFGCLGVGAHFFVEATTVNPTVIKGRPIQTEVPKEPEEMLRYQREYLPIKFGSALFSKLGRRYWEMEHVTGKPLVFAIQDFHLEGSMIWSQTALLEYLFGVRHHPTYDENGALRTIAEKIESHQYDGKEIPSGFFNLDGAENVSAVVFNTGGTISKFNRMGFLTAFGSKRIQMRRVGTCYDHDPNATEPDLFDFMVHDPSYRETWSEGINVVHNPRAKEPLPDWWLPGVAHHHLKDDQFVGSIPEFHPFGSVTYINVEKRP